MSDGDDSKANHKYRYYTAEEQAKFRSISLSTVLTNFPNSSNAPQWRLFSVQYQPLGRWNVPDILRNFIQYSPYTDWRQNQECFMVHRQYQMQPKFTEIKLSAHW
jgi:hypothetical protein